MGMENREAEVKQLVSSFVATLQPIIGYYRGVDGVDTLKHFEIRIEAERARYLRKFAALRDDPSCAGLGDVIDATERQINQIATNEISRVNGDGKIEFDSLIAQRAISDAVDQLNGKQKTREEDNV
jgi:hypothetical protein